VNRGERLAIKIMRVGDGDVKHLPDMLKALDSIPFLPLQYINTFIYMESFEHI
jgi:hypothetical protein